MIITIIQCDCGCNKKLEIGDGETPGAEHILQVTDAYSKKFFFLTSACLRKWLDVYEGVK